MKPLDVQVEMLKDLLIHADKLETVGHAFYDLTDRDDFLSEGEMIQSEIFITYLKAAAESLLKRKVEVQQSMCIHVPKYDLYHGPCFLGPFPGTMFFFEKLGKGLLIVQNHDQTEMARITGVLQEAPEGTFLVNPDKPATD